MNASLFTLMGAEAGVDLGIAEEAANRRFEGLALGASATLFTYTRWDVHEASMDVRPDAGSERGVRADFDLRVYDRASVDEDAVARIRSGWTECAILGEGSRSMASVKTDPRNCRSPVGRRGPDFGLRSPTGGRSCRVAAVGLSAWKERAQESRPKS
jgi:hypothetical protein